MAINIVKDPYITIIGRDGIPLEAGSIYIGEVDKNPRTYPKTTYFDINLTSAAVQPIKTLNGYPVNNGTPTDLFVDGEYSISIYDKNDNLVYSSISSNVKFQGEIPSIGLVGDLIGYISSTALGQVFTTGYNSTNDGGGGIFMWDDSADKSTANAGTIIDPSVSLANQGTGVGSGCWRRFYSGNISPVWFGAKGDGTTIDTTYVQKALNALNTTDKTGIDFVGKDYVLDSTIYFHSGAKLIGSGATIRCATTGFTDDGRLSSLTSLMANYNANFLAGEATDSNIEISGFNFISGSNVVMDSIYLANTKNVHIHNNKFEYQQAAQYTLAHVDCHHTNSYVLIEHNEMYHISTTIGNGACIAFRNSSSLIESQSLIASKNYMYKNGTSNTDEFMWVNGATGVTRECKILHNTFESGATDNTTSVLTIYPFTASGTITTSNVYDTTVQGNTFKLSSSIDYGILIGISGETRPAYNTLIDANIFYMQGKIAIKLVTLSDGLKITNNICIMEATYSGEFLNSDASVVASETVECSNNTLKGKYTTAFSGGFIVGNSIEECNVGAVNVREFSRNTILTSHYQGVTQTQSIPIVISENTMIFNTYDAGAGTLQYTYYAAADCVTEFKNNTIRYQTNGFYALRSANSSAAAANIFFEGNRLIQDGATDKPAFQTFTFPLGSSNDNFLYGVNTNCHPTAGIGVSGFSIAISHYALYNDIVAGGTVNVGYVNTSAGIKTIQTTVV